MIGLFFDTETTGVKGWWNEGFVPKLVQIGAILQDLDSGRVLAELNLIIDPVGETIPENASRVHGITTELARENGVGVALVDVLFAQFIKKADLLVAHNIAFDLDVVKDNLPLAYDEIMKSKIQLYCTMVKSVMLVKAPLTAKQIEYFRNWKKEPEYPYKTPTLTETYRHFFGVGFDGAHDAMADIRACRDIYIRLQEVERDAN